jgi:hypothetical protein
MNDVSSATSQLFCPRPDLVPRDKPGPGVLDKFTRRRIADAFANGELVEGWIPRILAV